MIKILFVFINILAFTNLVFSNENSMVNAKEALISSHVEFVKASIEQKCQKIKKKIKKLENELDYLMDYSEEEFSGKMNFEERRKEIMNQIQKYENKIDALKMTKFSIDNINFNSF